MVALRRYLSILAALALIAGPLVAAVQGCEETNTVLDAQVTTVDASVSCDAVSNKWQSQVLGDASTLGDSGVLSNYYAVWGVSKNEIFAVGTSGKVVFYNGKKWTHQKTPTTETLTSVWGTSVSDVWAVGFAGTVLHYNGNTWQSRPPPLMAFVTTDGGPPTKDAAVAAKRNLWGVWAARGSKPGVTSELWIVGDQGLVMFYDVLKNQWTNKIPITAGGKATKILDQLNGVWGQTASKVFIVGHFGTILSGSRTGFTKQQIYPTGSTKDLISVWGRSSGDVYAVGNSGTIVHLRSGTWTLVKGAPKQVLRGVWGPSSSTTYVIGWDGTLLRMTGGPSFSKGATFAPFNCVIPGRRLEGIWGTMVDGPVPDAGVPDSGIPRVPAIWIVGASGILVTGP